MVNAYFSNFCLSQRYNLTTLNIEDGLPSENVYDVFQDKNGFIWFGTLSGLARYDGYDFKVFNDADGLTDSKIKQIIAHKGKMLVLSWGYQLYEYHNGRFRNYRLDSIVNETILKLHSDGNCLWIGTREAIYGIYDDSIRIISGTQIQMDGLVPKDILKDGDELWIVNQWRGCTRYNLKTGKIRTFTSSDDGLVNDLNYCIHKSNSGSILVGGYGGVSEIRGDNVIKHFLVGEPNINRVMSITPDKNGGFWLALYGRGVVLWKGGQESFVLEGTPDIPDRYTYNICVDNENNKWVVTEGGGVYMFNDLSMAVYTRDHGLRSDKINSLHISRSNQLMIGSADGTLDIFTKKGIKTIPITDGGNLDMFVFDIEQDKNTTWVSANLGILAIREDGNRLYNSMQRGFEVVNASRKLSNGEILFGSLHGVFKIQADTFKYYYSYDNDGARTSSDTRTIVEDSKGTIWLGTLGNLWFLKGDRVTKFSLTNFRNRGFLCSAISPDGNAWFGGENLLMEVLYENGDTIAREYDIRKLLNAASLSAILFDGDDMWVAYERGILRISLSELRNNKVNILKRYSFESGFPASETSLGAMVMDTSEVIWVGTYKGLVRIDPAKHAINPNVPSLRLNGLDLFTQKILNKKKKVFDYDENYISFHFKAFNYNQSGDVVYSYRLDGLTNQWSVPGPDRKASYPYLPPGNYSFLVKAKYEDGNWSEPVLLYEIKIKAPFWKTWWFYTIVIASIVLVIMVLVYSRLRKIKLNAERSKAFSASLLKVQEEERVRIARDLHDTVGQNLLYVRNKVKEIPDGSQLSNQIDNTITEIRQIISAIHPMHIKNFGLSFALDSLKKKTEENSNIFVSTEVEKEADLLFDDEKALHIYRIAQEAFNNIVKHSSATAANITTECLSDRFIMRIRDNGKGFDFEKSRSSSVKSFGLTSMTERAEMIGGKIKVTKGKSNGTIIELTVRTNGSSNSR